VKAIEVGEPALLVDGRLRPVKLTKSVELLAYLAWNGGSASREDVISHLFDSRNDKAANAYLRMAANGVRDLLSDDCLQINADVVLWTFGALESDFTVLQTRYLRLRNVHGAQRFALATAALEDISSREYMAGSRSGWVVEQRARWATLLLDVRHAAAEAAFEVADYGSAHTLVDQVLEQDPYRERAWRLKMRVAGAVGDGDRVISSYRACAAALHDIAISPADSTRRLLQQLRS
jgi:DNA-binding SARP family transcriptional activator